MPASSLPSDYATRSRTMAAALSLGKQVDRWSLLAGAAALLPLLLQPLQTRPPIVTVLLALSLIAAIFQFVLALRVAFDAHIFADWAYRWSQRPTLGNDGCKEGMEADLARFDDSLKTLFSACSRPAGRRTSAIDDGPARPLENRLQGAARLLKRQLTCFAVQLLCLVPAIVLSHPFT